MSAAKPAYGGQAVIEGVLIRGKRTLALACRKPDGGIYRYRETIRSPLQRSRFWRLPLIRGIVVLGESLYYGARMLMRSADVQTEGLGQQKPSTLSTAATMGASLAFALLIFVGIPYGSTQLFREQASVTVLNLIEGLVQLVLLLLYIWAISFLPEIRRVFQYHGAEHMAIHAHEHGDPLDVSHVERYPTAHPRCGTAFLLLVAVVGMFAVVFMPRVHLVVDLAARLSTVFVVAAVSYEILRFGAAHERNPLMRAVVWPGLFLQVITTRSPDAQMIEVAIASLEEALAGDAEPEPAAA
jgi:uncharacterized protein YqhQ